MLIKEQHIKSITKKTTKILKSCIKFFKQIKIKTLKKDIQNILVILITVLLIMAIFIIFCKFYQFFSGIHTIIECSEKKIIKDARLKCESVVLNLFEKLTLTGTNENLNQNKEASVVNKESDFIKPMAERFKNDTKIPVNDNKKRKERSNAYYVGQDPIFDDFLKTFKTKK